MNDRKFLMWIHARLSEVHGENPMVDYMQKLRAIILNTPEDRVSPNIHVEINMDAWLPIETLKCEIGTVLLFAEAWKDEDFNPEGIREGFRNESDEGPIFSARWNDCHECWETDVGFEATHWEPRPQAPSRLVSEGYRD